MVILDQSKRIQLYLKIKIFKNPKFANCTFIIHRNRNKTSIQPILKSKSTSFMFNKKNCEIGEKVIHQGGASGNGGTVQIASWKCNFSIYLDIQVYYLYIQAYYLYIQAITTLLGLLLLLYVLLPSVYSFFYLTTTLMKSDIFRHSKSSQPTVFNLQALDWIHCEQETGAYYQLYRHTYKLAKFFLQISKVSYFAPKKYADFKKFLKVYYSYFFIKI